MLRQPSLFDLPIDFVCFGSGSSGNCYYLRHADCGILIDMGVGIRKFQKHFSDYGFKLPQVKAVLLTHDHLDHTRAVGAMSRKLRWPVYSTQAVHEGMRRNPVIKQKVPTEHINFIQQGTPFDIGTFHIEPFHVPHDASDNTGYFITCDNRVTFCLLTDVGHITPEMADYVQRAQYLVIESNYDPEMLASGPYPAHLQQRIRGGNGHLSNHQCGAFLLDALKQNTLKRLWLCHLSQENNTAEKATTTVQDYIAPLQLACQPEPLRRTEVSGTFTLI